MMDRDRLAVLVSEYEALGQSLPEMIGVDGATMSRWLRGEKVPRAQLSKLDWWDGQLQVHKTLEASGLPECDEARGLDERATSAILGKAPKKEQDRAARAALDHSSSCDLCKKRDAIRKAAGPIKGEPFPGYRRAMETPEDHARGLLWVLAVLGLLTFVAMYLERGLESDPSLPWFMGWIELLMPLLSWDGVRSSRSNQVAAGICIVMGVVGLLLTDFSVLFEGGLSPLIFPSVLAGIGLWIHLKK